MTQKAIVVGAGPGGLTAAIALVAAGFDPLVLECDARDRPTGSGLTLWPNAIAALETLELARPVLEVGASIDRIAMYTSRGRRLFGMGRPIERWFGRPATTVHRGELLDVLLGALDPSRVRFDTTCRGIVNHPDRVVVTLDDGDEIEGDLLIGADGIRSPVATALHGETELRYAGYTVWRGIANHQLDEPVGTTSMGRGMQFGMFQMTDNRVYWFASANAAENSADSSGGRKADVLSLFQDWHTPIRDVIEATDDHAILRNDSYDRAPRPRWTVARATLLGDAAHACTPTLGQGACQAIEDAVVLGRCLGRAADVVQGLRAYEQARHGRTTKITMQSRQIGRVGQWRNWIACGFRNTMIRMMPEALNRRQLRWMFEFEV